MPLKGAYNDILLTEILIKELKKGTIPTTDFLIEELDKLKEELPLLGDRPLFSITNNDVVAYESSSATKFNETFDRLIKDVEALWTTIVETRDKTIKQARRWDAYYSSTKTYLDRLEDRVDNLLLVNSDTLGYFQYVSDDFSTTDFTDLEVTTATLDTGTRTVTIGSVISDSKVNVVDISGSSVSFKVIQASGLVGSTLASGSSSENAISDEYTQWLSYITTSKHEPITGALTINLNGLTEVSKITLKTAGSTAISSYSITAMYSTDGVDYVVVPVDNSTQTVSDYASWSFPVIEGQYFKFLITKRGADDVNTDGNYVFEIGVKNVSFYSEGYDTESGNVFQSIDRSVLDTEGTKLTFSKVSLETCEVIPEGTNIYYSISTDSGSTFYPIDPINRKEASSPYVIDFANAVSLNNIDVNTTIDDSLDSDLLDFNEESTFVKIGESDQILNFYIDSTDVDSVLTDQIVLYRNTGDKTRVDETIRGISPGWLFDSETGNYCTLIRVDDIDGFNVDLGTTSLTLDGAVKTGSFNINKGFHEIEVSGINWLLVTGDISTLDDLKEADTLYPYNHKLILEGYDYGDSFTEERVYVGIPFFCERRMSYTTPHEFDTIVETNDISIYTRQVDDDENMIFIVKTDTSYSDHESERFLVEYKLASQTFTDVTLKAVLITEDESVSPTLEGYSIKLG